MSLFLGGGFSFYCIRAINLNLTNFPSQDGSSADQVAGPNEAGGQWRGGPLSSVTQIQLRVWRCWRLGSGGWDDDGGSRLSLTRSLESQPRPQSLGETDGPVSITGPAPSEMKTKEAWGCGTISIKWYSIDFSKQNERKNEYFVFLEQGQRHLSLDF